MSTEEPERFKPILPAHVDSTMLSAFRSCHQKHFKEFVRGIRPGKLSQDLHAGGVFAATLESVYKAVHGGRDFQLAMAEAEIFFYKIWGDFPLDPRNPKTPERMWSAVESYILHYGIKSDSVQPYILNGQPTFEYSFAIPLEGPDWPLHPVSGDPFLFVGRFDRLGEWEGLPVILDDKTTKQAGDTWASQWDLRGQFLGYLWACQQQGIQVENVCIRGVVIQKTQIRHLQVIRPYTKHLIALWVEQTRRDLHSMVKCWNEDYWDYNFGETCSMYRGCVFKELCESPNPTAWEANFIEQRWNPLLLDPLDPNLLLPADPTLEPVA